MMIKRRAIAEARVMKIQKAKIRSRSEVVPQRHHSWDPEVSDC
jgi:hypothetical protein